MITEHFNEILNNYQNSIKTGKFNKNHSMYKLIKYTTANAIDSIAKKHTLKTDGSPGKGNWTKYPWIGIFNEKISSTPQSGVYIVYLFSEDMNRVYLTLNQGYTLLKNEIGTNEAKITMIKNRKVIRNRVNNSRFNEDNNLKIGKPEYEIGTIFYKEYEKDIFPSEDDFLNDLEEMIRIYKDYYNLVFLKPGNTIKNIPNVNLGESDIKNIIIKIEEYIKSQGFIFSYEELSNFYLCLKTKPFILLAGISGTGKSKLVKLFSKAVGARPNNNRYNLISIKPDWNDSTELFGYKDINNKFITGQLTRIIDTASKLENIDKPFFICLDEMNLARVEYYLSEYLSIIETRYYDSNHIKTDTLFPPGYLTKDHIFENLTIPENIYIIGTVNMDDTTFAFSRKVLDRANTIEFSEVRLDDLDYNLNNSIKGLELDNSYFKSRFLSIKEAFSYDPEYVRKINNKIIEINNILAMGNRHYGYRVRDEIVLYMIENKINKLLDESIAFDFQIMQKILPTITGSDRVIKEILIDLYNYCNSEGEISDKVDYIREGENNLESALYQKSAKKILMMLKGYEDGFVSYWQ